MIRQTITKTDIEKFKLDMLKTNKSENTRKKYIRDITELQAYLSDESLKLSNAAVGAYVKYLLDAGYSISSVNSVISAINTFCSFIHRTDIHCAYLKNFVPVSESRTYLSTAEDQRLMAQAVDNEEYWLANFIQTIGNMDIRLNELDKLTVESLSESYISVVRARKSCKLQIPKDIVSALQEYVKFAEISEWIIFRSSVGNAMDRSNICKALKKLAKEAGLDSEKVSPRTLKRQLSKDFYTIDYRR